ncbi:PAS domain-containing protein [Geobacter pelophilus]|uniref:histidine kinase n=1 Tax=Geoanaerobacter pelophilus TaxID=60036 RepID=A0AAW4L7B2_9BACT|nr:PAS domain-containing hybrid sensor histidine kinase/response regulator [Geoanaerobacter pelophilus]MBT0663682.1 PAS domain-containing protein [Geoanaerobacter pelophilus]
MSVVKTSRESHAASQLMAIELISGLLVSTSPQKLGEVLTEQLRELSGAKTVMVLAHRPEPAPNELLHVSPLRRADLFSVAELDLFCLEKTPGALPYSPDELPDHHPLRTLLHRVGIQSVARFELCAGGEPVGLLLLFDLPELERIADTNQIITLLAPPIALALKNSLAYSQIEQQSQELENRVKERTQELHQKNIELLESENRLRYALEGTNDGLWDVQLQDGRTYLSPRGCEILGYPADEIDDLLQVWSDLVHPDDMPITEERLQAHIKGQAEIFEVEQRLRTKSGSWKWILTRGKVVERDPTGAPLRMTGTHSDISEKKQLESQLQQAQKLESIGRLAGGVAHDFNNLLTVILGHAELALLKTDPASPLIGDLTEIRNAAERSADLTRQLLAFARKQTIAPKVLDLNETVAGMLKMLQRLIGENIRLAWLPANNLWQLKVDPSQIDQILANLCVNARDAIDDVGKITIETGNCTFDADYCANNVGFNPGEYVLLAVSDNGRGIDQGTMAHIFEPFFTTKGVGEGTGLGLAMVYGIVRQNNGFITVYSELGQGTTFRVYLPRNESDEQQASTANAASPLSRGQETILLVEDEPSILVLTTKLLEKQGYRVLAANSPNEAIVLAKEHADEIQLLMTDVVMPEMNGRDLFKNLMFFCPKVKCLFMSGYTADVIAHHGVLDEHVYFISKPFSLSDLAAKVREALDSKSATG